MRKLLPVMLLSSFAVTAVAAPLPDAPNTWDLGSKYYANGQASYSIEFYQTNADYQHLLWVGVKSSTATSHEDIQWMPIFDSGVIDPSIPTSEYTQGNLQFAQGDEIVFRLDAINNASKVTNTYYSGYMDWNGDKQDHARAYYDYNDYLPEGSTTKTLVFFEDEYGLGDSDFNDIIIGINNVTYQAAAVPEPEAYAMLLAGLGLIGAVARRRRNK
ncbi:MAG: PEP-CTERM sorting domain-containing protein [Azoarcus sp.]|jgi:hypothetical protein|nr:PEP-CTERM sorting domain-containing protein [Azoarcus sp.]